MFAQWHTLCIGTRTTGYSGMLGKCGIQMPTGFNDLLEQGIPSVLDIAQVGGGLAPGQIPLKGFPQIQTQETGAHKRKMVDAKGAGIPYDLGFGAFGAACFAWCGAVEQGNVFRALHW
jgi:hypothetical protein